MNDNVPVGALNDPNAPYNEEISKDIYEYEFCVVITGVFKTSNDHEQSTIKDIEHRLQYVLDTNSAFKDCTVDCEALTEVD